MAPDSPSARRFVVCFCGGSGIAYGVRLVEALLEVGHEVHLVATDAAFRVLAHEAGKVLAGPAELPLLFSEPLRARLVVHAREAVEATPASGSAGIRATILVPCSMGTLARVAHGFSSNLVERAADVALKEGRSLIVVPRETPLSPAHLQNMLTLARLGATVLPAMPGFYHRPATVADLVDFVVGKILDRVGVVHPTVKRWGTKPRAAVSPWDEGEE